jgi:TonB family protein
MVTVGAPAATADRTLPECEQAEREVRIVSRQEPYYPHSARMFCLTGEVRAAFVIDAQGRTKDIRVLESDPEGVFDRAAVESIEAWRFIPACRDGEMAEREAVQTIEFRLPEESRQACSETVGQLDEETTELIGEIGARYALMAEFWQTGGSWSEVQSVIEAPFGEFSGDLARVAEFHRRTLAVIAESWGGRRTDRLFEDAVVALMAGSLAQDPQLDDARDAFERVRAAFDRQMAESRNAHRELATAYRQLEHDTQLDADTLALLVKPFTGDPEAPFDEVARPGRRSIENLERILVFLESTRGDWRVADGRIRFEDEEDAATSQALWDEFLEHRHEVESQAVNSMRSFRDYAGD